MIIGYTTGVFDMFHIGHLNILRRAKEQCDYLCFKRKQKYPIINERDRMAIVESIRFVDKVVPQSTMNKVEAVKKYGVNVVFVGSDWKGSDAWNKYEEDFAKVGCRVEYLSHTDGISSTILRSKIQHQ